MLYLRRTWGIHSSLAQSSTWTQGWIHFCHMFDLWLWSKGQKSMRPPKTRFCGRSKNEYVSYDKVTQLSDRIKLWIDDMLDRHGCKLLHDWLVEAHKFQAVTPVSVSMGELCSALNSIYVIEIRYSNKCAGILYTNNYSIVLS